MAGHPLEYTPFATVNPTGGTGARENIQTSPDMFGGGVARGVESIGQGVEKASDEGFDVATQQARIQSETHASELHSWQSDQVTDAESQYLTLRGKAAMDALPAFKQKIEEIHQQARNQAGNPYTARLVDSEGRRLTDQSYRSASGHAATQQADWETTTALDGASAAGSRAALAASSAPQGTALNANAELVLSLDQSDAYARIAASKKGLDGDIEAQRNRGKNLTQIVKDKLAQGSQQELQRTIELFHAQRDRIDPASAAIIENALKTQAATYNGQKLADQFMGRGPSLPAGYLQQTIHIESGGNPNAQNGSHGGLVGASKEWEARYGINDSNRNDPATVAAALSRENAENHAALAQVLGHEPTPADYYLAHQQGIGGAVSHLSQPNLPAWQNMFNTVEGHQKGAGWAKQAIWGNMTPGMRAQFPGGVETVTSGDFARMWAQRFYNQSIQATGAAPDNGSQTAGITPSTPSSFDRLQAAQDFSQTNKAEVIAKITNNPWLRDHPQEMNAAVSWANKVFEAQSANYADTQRQLKIAEQQHKIISDQAEDDYMKQIYTPPANAKPLSVTQIVNDPRLSVPSKTRLIKLIGGSEEKDDKTYGAGFVHALQMVHAPAGTEGRITDPNQLYDRVGKDLTFAGFTKLRDEINLKRSPEGEAETEMKRDFLRTAKGQISGSDEGLHIKDPKGDELYLKFMAQVLPAYDKGRKDGKSPAQLLDPDSPDYVGKIIKNFKRPMDQWFNDVVHADAPAASGAAKGAFDIKSVKSLDDLVAAYRAGNVTKQQADQMAIDNGWAVRKKPVAAVPVSQ